MKKITVFLILLVSFCLFAMSDTTNTEPIPKEEPKIKSNKLTQQEIQNVAINYYRETMAIRQFNKGIIKDYDKAIKLENIKFEIDSVVIEGLTLSYFFNFEPKGFVKVSAVNTIEPVPESSEEGFVDVSLIYKHRNDPGSISLIHFDKDKNRVYKSYYKKPTEEILKQWDIYKVSPKEFEVKKNFKNDEIGSKTPSKSQTFTKWHQKSPYWDKCPTFMSSNTKAGCVAVAMAQMMKYHEWPSTGIGSNSYNWFNGEILKTLSSSFNTHDYNWSIMPNIAYANGSDSTAQVAQICYDAGISVNMRYGTGGLLLLLKK